MDSFYTKKASILIWSVFLLLFLSTSFIYISIKIGNYMDKSEWLTNSSDLKYDFLNSWISPESDEIYTLFPDNSYTWTLRQLEETEYRFTWTWTQTANLILTNSWVISYKLLLVNSSYTVWTISSSWTISNWFTSLSIPLTNFYTTALLYFKNMWWITKYNISSSSSFLSSKRWYQISTNIWGKNYMKTIWEITNFTWWYLTWTFDLSKYQFYWLYRN